MQIGDAGELHVFGNMELRDDVAKFIADEIDEFYDLLLPEVRLAAESVSYLILSHSTLFQALILALARTSVEFSVASVETLVNAYPDCVETVRPSLIAAPEGGFRLNPC